LKNSALWQTASTEVILRHRLMKKEVCCFRGVHADWLSDSMNDRLQFLFISFRHWMLFPRLLTKTVDQCP